MDIAKRRLDPLRKARIPISQCLLEVFDSLDDAITAIAITVQIIQARPRKQETRLRDQSPHGTARIRFAGTHEITGHHR
ncbi:hypothetical protein Thiowin_01120 [Thiorhodovibrio winogradskyi]|uniref:Uncharacterized protein n=1 Tax=Thiorhodovibrio winogradskyi TaxID=77007 RepID=A0ABZ0S779_9GAMM